MLNDHLHIKIPFDKVVSSFSVLGFFAAFINNKWMPIPIPHPNIAITLQGKLGVNKMLRIIRYVHVII